MNLKIDESGEVINGEETYEAIAEELRSNAVLVGWTDGTESHLDILFTYTALIYGVVQGGVKRGYLFVSIMRRGSFGFDVSHKDTHAGYYEEKLGNMGAECSEKVAELINGVKKYLAL